MTDYRFVAPGRARKLVAWLAPGRTWGVVLMICPWMFHVGIEAWRKGVCLNLGPLSLGIAAVEPADAATRSERTPRNASHPLG